MCVLLAAGACTTPSQPAPDSGSPPATEATTLPSETTTTSISDGPIRGALPDGTIYDVILEPRAGEEVTEVTAGLFVDPAEEVVEVSFRRDDDRPAGREGETYRLRDGAWTAELRFPSSALEIVAPDLRASVEESVRLSTHLGLPVMELEPPWRWAGDDTVPMQVSYETFAVRRGCPGPAVACNPTHAVGAIPLEEISPDAPTWSAEAEVVSYSLRPSTDPHYYDPGPLAGRSGHDLLWTGEEMIVWGGTGPLRMDGAAFDPDTGEWRMLPSVPLEDQPTRALWAGERMVVVSAEATVAYQPEDDSWVGLGDGLEPSPEPGLMVWTGDEVMVGDDGGVRAFRPELGRWRDLPSPGPPPAGLRMEDGRLYAIGGEVCPERLISEWTGESWREVTTPPSPEQGCPHPAQVAVGGDRFVVWHDVDQPTLVYEPSDGRWAEAVPVPLPPLDRPSGPLDIGGGRFLVPGNQEGAIFDPTDNTWTRVDLPGHGRAETTVWTGSEVLMWDRCCYEPDDVDSWRWTPPD